MAKYPQKGERRGGRAKGTPNKVTRNAREEFLPFGPAATKKIVHFMNNGESEEIRFRAAQEIHNRIYGKPTQQTNLAGHEGGPLFDVENASPEELEAAAEMMLAGLAKETKDKQ